MLRHVETNVAEQFLKSRVHCAPPLRARSVLRSFVEFVFVERKTELVNHMHQEPCCCFGTLRGAIFQRKNGQPANEAALYPVPQGCLKSF